MQYTLRQRAIEVHKVVALERKTMSDLSNNNIMKNIEKKHSKKNNLRGIFDSKLLGNEGH